MKIKMYCSQHQCPVVSAEGTDLYWIPRGNHELRGHFSEWELDETNLYCIEGDDFHHTFHYIIEI